MSKRKGLTQEEKATKLLELFHESCEVFQLKELERIAPKEKGIVQQSIKSTLQELVDNGIVRSEKIAGCTCYWAFPSDSVHNVKIQLEATEEQSKQLEIQIASTLKRLETLQADAANAIHAEVLEKEIESLTKEKELLQTKLSNFQDDFDYENVSTKEKNSVMILDACNRWTDNIFATKSWCKRKFYKEDQEMNKAFGIPEDLDYLEP